MPAKEKVGAWLGNASAADDEGEHDSDGNDSSAQSDSPPNGRHNGNGNGDGDKMVKESHEVDWETVLPLVRPALEDPSDVRRRAFVARNLVVRPECECEFC